MLSAVAKVLKTVTGSGKVVTQTVAAGLSNGLNLGTRAALLDAANASIQTAAKGAKETVRHGANAAAATTGLVNGLNVGTRTALLETTKATTQTAAHAAKQGVREIGEEFVEMLSEVPKGVINAAGLGGAASAGVGASLRAAQKAAKATTGQAIASLKVPQPVGVLPVSLAELAEGAIVQTGMVGAELLNTSYEGVVQGGLSVGQKVKAGILNNS